MASEQYSYEVFGKVFIGENEDSGRECDQIVVFSPMGIETHLYLDAETRELVLAEQIDGTWGEIDLAFAAEKFSEVIYACQ